MPKRQYQILISEKVGNALTRVMEKLRPVSPKKPRVLERGPMIGYVCRWFVTLDGAEQLRIVMAGRQLTVEDGDEDGIEDATPNIDAMPTTDIIGIYEEEPVKRKGAPKKGRPKRGSK